MGASIEDVLFPGIDVRLEGVSVTAALLFVDAVACGRPPCCPGCLWRGRRVHSTYRRTLSERPLGGQKLVVRLRVRRFFCDRKSCSRRTFVEQVDRLTERRRRSSLGLKEWLTTVAVELGGRAGERLCRKLNLAAGRTRLVKLLEEPPTLERAPRVLGVDEFAFRRGRRYGTILVDVEAGRVVDVLRDRTSETFAAWLTAHPGAEIVCRDRASTYTKAIKEAAPDAMEIADRWHLLQNETAREAQLSTTAQGIPSANLHKGLAVPGLQSVSTRWLHCTLLHAVGLSVTDIDTDALLKEVTDFAAFERTGHR